MSQTGALGLIFKYVLIYMLLFFVFGTLFVILLSSGIYYCIEDDTSGECIGFMIGSAITIIPTIIFGCISYRN